MLAIKGRRGHMKISPFYRGSGGGQKLIILGKLPEESFEIFWELNRGTQTIRELRQIVFISEDDATHIVVIPDDMKASEQLVSEFVKLGIGRAKKAHVFAREDEIEWMNSLLSGLKIESPIQWTTPRTDNHRVDIKLMSLVNDKYFRALAKIGFHYFLKHVNQFDGSEDAFQDIREFITHGGDVDKFIGFSSQQLAIQIYSGLTPSTYVHVLAIEINTYIFSRLQFFLGPDYRPLVWTIRLGKNPSKIHYPQAIGHSFAYYEDGRQDNYDGEMADVTPIRKRLLR